MRKITKYFLLALLLSMTFGCASDGWHLQRERERFIRLSQGDREKARDWCKKNEGCWMSLHKEPTPQELERLKNKDSWKYKARSWYYGIWE
ncbi:MAG: hypothetical protein RL769_109 [Pseudomonadota bacterium]|jgi:hypothetical protein